MAITSYDETHLKKIEPSSVGEGALRPDWFISESLEKPVELVGVPLVGGRGEGRPPVVEAVIVDDPEGCLHQGNDSVVQGGLGGLEPPVLGAPDQPAEDLGGAPLVGLVPAAGQSLQVRPEHRHHVLAKVSEQTLEQIEPLDAEPVTEKKLCLSQASSTIFFEK